MVLAAGASRRLPGPKQLLRYRGVTLLRHAAQTALAAACGPVVVVLAADAGTLRFELVDLDVRIVENPGAAKGLSTSVRAGLQALESGASAGRRARRSSGGSAGRSSGGSGGRSSGAGGSALDAALFMTCDQPQVTPELLRRLVSAFLDTRPPAVACEYAGTVGVPALLGRVLFAELRELEGDQGAKRVLQRHLSETVRIPFEPGDMDIDTPEDAQRLM